MRAVDERLQMLPDKPQFNAPRQVPFKPKPLPNDIKKNYEELSALLTLQIKQAKLLKLRNQNR